MNSEIEDIKINAINAINKIAETAIKKLQSTDDGSKRRWRAERGQHYLYASYGRRIEIHTEEGGDIDDYLHKNGNYFPYTETGRIAAEKFISKREFLARWRMSADLDPNVNGFIPHISMTGHFMVESSSVCYGLPKWSTYPLCVEFINSEGGVEKVKEILERGIL